MELSAMDRINMILQDPEKHTMTLAQIVSEEVREFKASEQFKLILEAERYYRNRSSVRGKTVDVASRSNTKIERPILKRLVDQKANYLLSKPWTVDAKNGAYGGPERCIRSDLPAEDQIPGKGGCEIRHCMASALL